MSSQLRLCAGVRREPPAWLCNNCRRAGTRSGPSITAKSSSCARSRSAQYVVPARVAPATIRTSWRSGWLAATSAASAGSSGRSSAPRRQHEPLHDDGGAVDLGGPHHLVEQLLQRVCRPAGRPARSGSGCRSGRRPGRRRWCRPGPARWPAGRRWRPARRGAAGWSQPAPAACFSISRTAPRSARSTAGVSTSSARSARSGPGSRSGRSGRSCGAPRQLGVRVVSVVSSASTALLMVSARTRRMSRSSRSVPSASPQLSGGTRNSVGAGRPRRRRSSAGCRRSGPPTPSAAIVPVPATSAPAGAASPGSGCRRRPARRSGRRWGRRWSR